MTELEMNISALQAENKRLRAWCLELGATAEMLDMELGNLELSAESLGRRGMACYGEEQLSGSDTSP